MSEFQQNPGDRSSLPEMPIGKNLIGGRWRASGDLTFKAFSPVEDDSLTPTFTEATNAEIDESVAVAAAAFLESRKLKKETRIQLLEGIASLLEARSEVLLERCMLETGYGLGRAKGELVRTINQTRGFASMLREGSWVDARINLAEPNRRPLPKPDVRSMLQPLGPVAVVGASNFPFAISVAGTDTCTALAAGCSVVVKSHPGHPGTCELIAEVIREVINDLDLPAGLFALLHGQSERVGQRLVSHPKLAALAFTGSEAGGRAFSRLAAERDCPIPVFAEQGSVNPVVVSKVAANQRSDEIADGFLQSLLLGGGQFCTNPGLLLVPANDDGDRLVERFRTALGKAPIAVLLHRGISENYRQRVHQREGRTQGKEETHHFAHSVATSDLRCAAVPAVEIVNGTDFRSECFQEIFGPFSTIVRWHCTEEILDILGNLPGQLTATLHADDDEHEEWAAVVDQLQLKSGRFLMNGFPTGVEPCDAMHHGGPFPAASLPHFTSIGNAAIKRFVRPMCYQDLPESWLPEELRNANPHGIMRMVDGLYTDIALE